MEYKDKMSRLLIILLAVSSVAHGECFTRSSTLSEAKHPIERITDVERTLLPGKKNTLICRVTFRAYINGAWETVEGEDAGPKDGSIDQLCAQAVDTGRARIIEKVSGRSLRNTQEMICTDEENLQVEEKNVVNIGDVGKDSQVQPHPLYKEVFQYRGSQCRWFVESVPRASVIDMNQGIICKSPNQRAWKVVDKW